MSATLFRPSGIAGKILLVLAGYVLAVVLAFSLTAIYLAMKYPGGRGSGGMAAFGDSILFLWVLGVVSVPATAAALYFLRPCRWFWELASVVGLIAAAVAVTDLTAVIARSGADATSPWGMWSMLAPVRVLLTLPLAAGLLLAGVFAPGGRWRLILLAATAVEAVTFVSVFLIWFSRSS